MVRLILFAVVWLSPLVGLPLELRAAEEGAAALGALQKLEVSAGVVEGEPLRLIGGEARRQLIVTGHYAQAGQGAGNLRDLTGAARYRVTPEELARVEASGLVVPLADGEGKLTIESAGAPPVEIPLIVERIGDDPLVNFSNQIVPIFTKLGCNGGGCHGKLAGQNGFRLSLLGFEPAEDYEHLAKEARGRRLSLAAPERSLLLLKATATLPHGGGGLLERDSASYRLLARWIAEGANFGDPEAARVASLEVFPQERLLPPDGRQQLRVMAVYTDGAREDVTSIAQYEANVAEMAEITSSGLVTTARQTGDVAVMVRYQSHVAVFRATIPLGGVVVELPPAKNFIDELVFQKLRTLGLPASPVCDDSAFLRRVTLDIAGRLPTLEEAQNFLADADPAKRERLIDRLVDSRDYADHFANKWSAILRNKRSDDAQHRHGAYSFHDWIRRNLHDNTPYDQFVRDILAASGETGSHPPVTWYRQVRDPHSQVEDAAQLFLGQRLQCARCHHHPYEKWSTDDYFHLAAFFSRVARKPGLRPGEERVFHSRGVAQLGAPSGTVKPAALGGAPLEIALDEDPRHLLVDWMTDQSNPFFARTLVNRYWKHFFSRGLVEPEDDMRLTNPATNPELLDALARHFTASGYDLKDLARTICRSTTYQLASLPNERNADDKQNFSRYYPRRLTAEVALDAVDALTGKPTRFPNVLAETRAVQLPDTGFDNYFLTVFGRPDSESACECERVNGANLAQSLHLINSSDILGKLTGDESRAAQLANDKETRTAEKIRQLYLRAFAREPEAEEVAAVEKYLAERQDNLAAAYEDVIWSLLNTKEFLFNH